MSLPTARRTIWEDTGLVCLARIVGNTTSAIANTDVTKFTRKIFDEQSTAPNTAIATSTVTSPTTSVIHSLKTDGRWSEDSIGFNFSGVVHPSTVVFAKPSRTYRIEYHFTPASTGDVAYKAVFFADTEKVRGS